MVFLILKKGSEAGRGLFEGDRFFLDELAGGQGIIELLDVDIFGVDLAQEPGVVSGSHIFLTLRIPYNLLELARY